MKIIPIDTDKKANQLFHPLSEIPFSFFLDTSAETKATRPTVFNTPHRFSFFGAFPYKIVYSIQDLEKELSLVSASFLLQQSLEEELMGVPFLGGAVGFISYEASRMWEMRLNAPKKRPFQVPNILFGFYDSFFVVDHQKNTTSLISLNLTPKSKKKSELLKDLVLGSSLISTPSHQKHHKKKASPTSNITQKQYGHMIKKAKQYIEEGEIYQVNLSQCLQATLPQKPYAIYETLRNLNPSPFSAYLNFDSFQILSSSPERFISVNKEGWIQTEPIKGTIRRGETPQEDNDLKQRLLSSEKDRAELMMIVDLERNDLGKICHYGSISVSTLYTLKSFATVHHLVSEIQGKLKTKNIFEIIKACFPGGSITGAPKLRAMQIIDELEPHNRGIYTGSIGYIDYRRQIDLNIAIRTLVRHQETFYFPVGGGIVSDSDPTEEYEETLQKAKALISAISNQ